MESNHRNIYRLSDKVEVDLETASADELLEVRADFEDVFLVRKGYERQVSEGAEGMLKELSEEGEKFSGEDF